MGGEAAETILDFAKKGAFDLFVITTHGLSGLGRWVLDSVAEKVIRVSSLPVYVVQAKNPDKSTDALRFPSEMERFGGPQRESPGLMALLNKK